MPSKKRRQFCWYCEKERDRCRVVTVLQNGTLEYCCPQCWKENDMDKVITRGTEAHSA